MMRAILVVLAAILSIPVGAHAQEGITGYRDGARRDFQAQGMRLMGTSALSAVVYRFDDPEAASDAVGPIVDLVLEFLEKDGGAMRPASAPDLGDEVQAFSGEIAAPGDSEFDFTTGIVVWREGPVVRLVITAAIAGDPLSDAFAVAREIAGREPVGETVLEPVREGQMRQGGPWDLLPTLDDVPEGLVFTGEESFAGPSTATPTP